MNSLQRLIRMCIALGILSFISLVISFFALTDIAHGESDLSLEWASLKFSALILLMFIAMTLTTLSRVIKSAKAEGKLI